MITMETVSLPAPEKCPNCGSEHIVIASFEPHISCGDCGWEQK